MPAVQHVEAAVGEHDAVAAAAVLADDGEQVAVLQQPAAVRRGELGGQRARGADGGLLAGDDDVRGGLRDRERRRRAEVGAQRQRVGGGEGVARPARPGLRRSGARGVRCTGSAGSAGSRTTPSTSSVSSTSAPPQAATSASRCAAAHAGRSCQRLRRRRAARRPRAALGVTTSGRTSHQPSGSRPSTTSSGISARSATSRSRTGWGERAEPVVGDDARRPAAVARSQGVGERVDQRGPGRRRGGAAGATS